MLSVWYSTPGLLGSSRFRIAAWAPYSAGLMSTVKVRGWFFGSEIVVGLIEKTSVSPTRDRLYVVEPPPPEVRTNV